MRWSNVALIFRREVRDQLRDRRTLFMIFVLPILLYPILGIGVLKFAATLEEKPRIRGGGRGGKPAEGPEPPECRMATDSIPNSSTRPRRPIESSSSRSRARAPGAIRPGASARSARAGLPR